MLLTSSLGNIVSCNPCSVGVWLPAFNVRTVRHGKCRIAIYTKPRTSMALHACRHGPMTYKELMRELPDDITPEDAQKEYQTYLTEWWGSEVRWAMLCSCHLRVGAWIQ